MAKEFEKYFVKQLQAKLKEFLKDFTTNNVAEFKVGMSNCIKLEKLVIRKDVLLKFHVPMYLLDGKIGVIQIDVLPLISIITPSCPSTRRTSPLT